MKETVQGVEVCTASGKVLVVISIVTSSTDSPPCKTATHISVQTLSRLFLLHSVSLPPLEMNL